MIQLMTILIQLMMKSTQKQTHRRITRKMVVTTRTTTLISDVTTSQTVFTIVVIVSTTTSTTLHSVSVTQPHRASSGQGIQLQTCLETSWHWFWNSVCHSWIVSVTSLHTVSTCVTQV